MGFACSMEELDPQPTFRDQLMRIEESILYDTANKLLDDNEDIRRSAFYECYLTPIELVL